MDILKIATMIIVVLAFAWLSPLLYDILSSQINLFTQPESRFLIIIITPLIFLAILWWFFMGESKGTGRGWSTKEPR